MHQPQTAFENIVGKGEIARNKQFLHFPQYLLLNWIIVSPFVHIFDIISLFAAELEEPKIGISGKWFMLYLSVGPQTSDVKACLYGWEEKMTVVKKLLMLLNSYTPPEIRVISIG